MACVETNLCFPHRGLTALMRSITPADYPYHDTYFAVAHFHYAIFGRSVLQRGVTA